MEVLNAQVVFPVWLIAAFSILWTIVGMLVSWGTLQFRDIKKPAKVEQKKAKRKIRVVKPELEVKTEITEIKKEVKSKPESFVTITRSK